MTNCTQRELWNTDFNLLADDEFEKLLDHSALCEYHARVLDAYNEGAMPMLQAVLPAGPLHGRMDGITRMDIIKLAFEIKTAPVREALQKALSFIESWLQIGAMLFSVPLTVALMKTTAPQIMETEDLAVVTSVVMLLVAFTFLMVQKSRTNLLTNEGGTMMLFGDSEPFSEYNGSVISHMPERLQAVELTEDEKELSRKVKSIISTGLTPENCRAGLELLAENEAVVSTSWTHTLNKARFLRVAGDRQEAESLTRKVIEDHWDTPQARGTGFEILSWFIELDYNEGGCRERNLLDRRAYFITEGLKIYPDSCRLLISALELAILRGDAEEARDHLQELVRLDRDVAMRYFADNPHTEAIRAMDPRLKREIEKLCLKAKGAAVAMEGVQARNTR